MPPRTRKQQPVALSSAAPADEPLPALVSPDTPPPAVPEPPVTVAKPRRKAPPASEDVVRPPRSQHSVYLPNDLWDRARGFVAYVQWHEVEDEPDTLADLVTEALESMLAGKEKTYNKGQPFRRKALATGPGQRGRGRIGQGRAR